MVIRMVRPGKRKGTKNVQFRYRVPAAVADKVRGQRFVAGLPSTVDAVDADGSYRVECAVGTEIKFSLGTDDPRLVRVRHAAATAAVLAFLSAAERGPIDLTHRQLQAVLGLAYRQIVGEHEDNPPVNYKQGQVVVWSEFEVWQEIVREADELAARGNAAGRTRAVKVLNPLLDIEAFLSAHSIHLSDKSRGDLVEALPKTVAAAMHTLMDRSQGDYSADRTAALYPDWVPTARTSQARKADTSGHVKTFDDLFDRWKAESKRAASTLSTWRGYMTRFTNFIGHDDPHRVEKVDAQRWKDALVAEGLKKVSTTYLATFNTLYRFGLSNSETTGISRNPFDGVKAQQKAAAGSKRLPFSRAEVALILNAARGEKLPHVRWIPWLQAQTGARVAEVAQLWGSMIVKDDDGRPCINITVAPDGGTLKNEGSERTVPIHSALIADGFLEFVETRAKGPLFYGGVKGKAARQVRDDQKHPSKGVSNRVGTWVRGLGIEDPRKAPTHSFRHWYKSEMMRLGVVERLVDKIQGHSDKSDASGYAHGDTAMMLEAIEKLDLKALADSAPKVEPEEQS